MSARARVPSAQSTIVCTSIDYVEYEYGVEYECGASERLHSYGTSERCHSLTRAPLDPRGVRFLFSSLARVASRRVASRRRVAL